MRYKVQMTRRSVKVWNIVHIEHLWCKNKTSEIRGDPAVRFRATSLRDENPARARYPQVVRFLCSVMFLLTLACPGEKAGSEGD